MNLLEAVELNLPRGFRIQGQIGVGASSTVYLAEQEGSRERRVVKVMRPGTVSSSSVDRFLREMQTLQSLQHPRIIPILEPGEANGALFFTMPHIPGVTLRRWLHEQGPLPVEAALRVTLDVTEALAHAHSRGIVHRDVKPENVLIGEDGAAYLMDFGLANPRAIGPSGEDGKRTLVGTPLYMSPEQVSARRPVDRRSDFYSLGCMLYEMLTGRPPFHGGSSKSAMMKRLNENPVDARLVRPDVSEELARVLRRMLDRDPSGRYPTAAALSSALETARAAPAA
jgi:serine/threonine protein kinase